MYDDSGLKLFIIINSETMTLTDLIIQEYDFEMFNTRKTLELIPSDKLDWRPHDKSYSFGQLGMHIVDILSWAEKISGGNSYNLNVKNENCETIFPGSCKDILDNFDKQSFKAHEALLQFSDSDLAESWTLLSGQTILLTLPKYYSIRQLILNHSIHHRAQLTVYLRLNNIPLPNLYGQTADDAG